MQNSYNTKHATKAPQKIQSIPPQHSKSPSLYAICGLDVYLTSFVSACVSQPGVCGQIVVGPDRTRDSSDRFHRTLSPSSSSVTEAMVLFDTNTARKVERKHTREFSYVNILPLRHNVYRSAKRHKFQNIILSLQWKN